MSIFNTFRSMLRRKPRTFRKPNPELSRTDLRLEALEDRTLMAAGLLATFDYGDGILRIAGTDQADQIRIVNNAGQISVEGNQIKVINEGVTSTVAALPVGDIRNAYVRSLGGDDTIELIEQMVTSELALKLVALGDQGNDTIIGGSAQDGLHGGIGNDILRGNGGNDYLEGSYTVNVLAAQLDRDLGLYASDNYEFENWSGRGEKWVWGSTPDQAYFILPNGELYSWDGTYQPADARIPALVQEAKANYGSLPPNYAASGTLVATLDPSYHQNPLKLVNAQSLFGSPLSEDPLGPLAAQLDRNLGLEVEGEESSYGQGEKWFYGNGNDFYFIMASGALYRWDGSDTASGELLATLNPSFYQDTSKLADAQYLFGDQVRGDTLSEADLLAVQFDRDLGLFSTGSLYENWGGKQERWIVGNGDQWYFILPNGALYQWDGTDQTASGKLVGALDPSYYQDIVKLVNAQNLFGTPLNQDPKGSLAAQLDRDLGLAAFGDENWGGKGEKWFYGNNDQSWYFILPNGELHRWDEVTALVASGELVATLDPSFHTDISKLADAQYLFDAGLRSNFHLSDTDLRAAQLDRDLGLYATNNQWENYWGVGEKWVMGIGEQWYYILPSGRVYNPYSGALLATLDSSYHQDIFKLVNAHDLVVTPQDSFGAAAAKLDRSAGLYAVDTVYENWGGRGEKWVMGADGWYFILPRGAVYRWDGSNQASGVQVATLDASYHRDLSKLVDAQNLVSDRGDNDTVFGGDGSDTLVGGDGNDRLVGENDSDTISGGRGNDELIGCFYLWAGETGNANDTIFGGEGDDSLYGGDGNDWLEGQDGSDYLKGDDGADMLIGCTYRQGNEGLRADDTIIGGRGNDALYGGDGNDWLEGQDGSDYLKGDNGNDTLIGCTYLNAYEGIDANDVIEGGAGDDSLYGGNGEDWLEGQDGTDYLKGDAGIDSLFGGSGLDRFDSDAGNDYIVFAGANDGIIGVFDGNLGVATSSETSILGGRASVVYYQYGAIYSHGGAMYALSGGNWLKYQELGGHDGFLGLPVSGELSVLNDSYRIGKYEGGTIVWKKATGEMFHVRGLINQKWNDNGGITGWMGAPLGNEAVSWHGVVQNFQNASIYFKWGGSEAFEVHGAIRDKWLELGGETGFLGYPISDEHDGIGGSRVSSFENGTIFWTADRGTWLSFDRKEMINLLGQVGRYNGIDEGEFNFLRGIIGDFNVYMPEHVRNLANKVVNGDRANNWYQGVNVWMGQQMGNLAPGSSGNHLQLLVNKWFLGLDRPIANGTAGTTYGYALASGTLFHSDGTPWLTDVDQGDVGDCYLLSALGAVRERHPEILRDMFIDNGDGTFTVRFFRDGRPEYVTVDRQLPFNADAAGNQFFAFGNNSTNKTLSDPANILWAALAEKAYAQLNQSGWIGQDNSLTYQGISGGGGAAAFSIITGRWAEDHDLKTWFVLSVSNMTDDWRSGKMVTLNTYDDRDDVPNALISPKHAYTLVSVSPDGQSFLVYNPWATDFNPPANDGIDDGFLMLTRNDIIDNFEGWSACD